MSKTKTLSIIMALALGASGVELYGQAGRDTTSRQTVELDEVQVRGARPAGTARSRGVVQGLTISRAELTRAACCNLGESFTTNPSVDVSYSDAATGARQVRLLGLSGAYVQILLENMPNLRGLAQPYALGYVPGPWMQSIQVSKGSASVKNGYEGITGQINVEYLKPQGLQELNLNLYGDTKSKVELNADAGLHLSPSLSTSLLAHYEQDWAEHDANHDGFVDKPSVRQFNILNRWAWITPRYILQAGLQTLGERRQGGQASHATAHAGHGLYRIGIETARYEAFVKQALILDPERDANIALITSASLQHLEAGYGHKLYDAHSTNLYASLIYETTLGRGHSLSTGLALVADDYRQRYRMVHAPATTPTPLDEGETTLGAYAQYTYTTDRLTLMGGLRLDRSSLHGVFVTPRVHVKYTPLAGLTLRGSVGRGYRTLVALPEYHYLLASGRTLQIEALPQEASWTLGGSIEGSIALGGRDLRLGGEYYYTTFDRQAVLDMDSRPGQYVLGALSGRSFSHSMQIEASYYFLDELSITTALRYTDARTTYAGRLLERPLTSRYKGLATLSYRTPLGLWQIDATLQLNGGGRMPTPAMDALGQPLWRERYDAYEQLSLQITRYFRGWSLYLGGENLTGRYQREPIIGTSNPWGQTFDPTMVWGPVHGAMIYAGVRIKLSKD